MTLRFVIAAMVGASLLMISEQALLGERSSLVTSADARIGRPLTPLSYAGVARRTTRRAIYGGAVVGAPVVVAPRRGCVQVVDAYGRIITRCY
jgi:hypothetical protein